MKFIISRTSEWRDSSPCAEAKKGQIVMTEVRSFRSPEDFDAKRSAEEGAWLSVGTNHRIRSDGCVCRDRGMMDVWVIEINSLEELIALSKKYGNIIVSDYYLVSGDENPSLEIYDDYRE